MVIHKVPPAPFLEAYDLRPYRFQEGNVYEVEQSLASVLIAWDYADLLPPAS